MRFADMNVQLVAKNSDNVVTAHLPNDQEGSLT